MVLLQERQFVEAAQHMRTFLQHATKPEEVQDAQKQLATIQQLSASVVVPDKK
jgi:hypothetical protein